MTTSDRHPGVVLPAPAGLVDKALSDPWYVLSLPNCLEARYRASKHVDRLRYQQRAGIVGVIMFVMFLASDAVVVPDVFWLGVILRGACLAVTSAAIMLLRPGLPYWLTSTLAASLTLPAIATIAVLFSLSRAPDRVSYLNGIDVCVTFANICLQQRFRWVAGSNVLILAIVLAGLYTSHVAVGVQLLQALLLITSMLLTLLVTHRLEWQSRRSHLLTEQDQYRRAELQRSNALLTELSEQDQLTGLANRRKIDRYLQDAWTACAVQSEPIALIMLDVDWFKRFNDTYGHPAGDACLSAISNVLRDRVQRVGYFAGRYGGEEFIVIMKGVDPDAARLAAERLRLAIERLNIPHSASSTSNNVTVSLGLAYALPSAGLTADDVLQAADKALYAAKRDGRAQLKWATLAA